jgi:hypothetical protein
VPSPKTLRVIHVICSVVVGTLVYAPHDVTEGTFETLVAVVFFPLVVITGLLMWFGVARKRAAARS